MYIRVKNIVGGEIMYSNNAQSQGFFLDVHSHSGEKVQQRMKISCVLHEIRFQKDDFIIGSCYDGEKYFSVKGNLYNVTLKESLILYGYWEMHNKYGNQFVIESWERPMPSTKEMAIKFLSSKLVKGCSEKLAHNIVEKLGDNAIEIIEKQGTDALKGIRGIGEKKRISIAESVCHAFSIQRIASELKEYGITLEMVINLYKNLKEITSELILSNPYLLMKHAQLDFYQADGIAMRMGIKPFSSHRIEACLTHVLNQICYASGHTFVTEAHLFSEVLKVINHNQTSQNQVALEEIEQTIYQFEGEQIIFENGYVYPKRLYDSECNVAEKIARLMKNRHVPYKYSEVDFLISKYQRKEGIILAEQQREAIRTFVNEPIMVLTGGPGTGKTTVVRAMVDIYKMLNPDVKIALAAPTGRASRRLAEVTNMNAVTMHRLIGFNGEFVLYDEHEPLPYDLFILDEMSMTDVELASKVFSAIKKEAKVVLVGDIDQLPSVGAGNVLADIMNSSVPTIRLQEVFRQAMESQIVANAHKINNGLPIVVDQTKDDFYFIEERQIERVAGYIVASVQRFLKMGYKLSEILVLSPMKKGDVGVLKLNERIREKVNPPSPSKNEFRLKNRFFREGDKIIQTKNDDEKDLSNGDLGIVVAVETHELENGKTEQTMLCDFGDRQVTFYKDDLKHVELAYTITIHKSQGGESPIVIIPVVMAHRRMLIRNLLYTGITRAKEKIVLIGTMEALMYGVENNEIVIRNSSLTRRIEVFSSGFVSIREKIYKSNY